MQGRDREASAKGIEEQLNILASRLKLLEDMLGIPENISDEQFVSMYEALCTENKHLKQVMRRAARFIEANLEILSYEKGFQEKELLDYLSGNKKIPLDKAPFAEEGD